jgi:chaperonin GroES
MGIKLVPFGDQVVVKPIHEADTTEGGIILVESAKETPTRGEVLAVGPGRIEGGVLIEPRCEVGQTVIYKKYAGTDVKVGDDELVILQEKHLLVAVDED